MIVEALLKKPQRVGRVTMYSPNGTQEALSFFYNKLCYETDPADVYADVQDGEPDFVVIDARSHESYLREHVPGAINMPHKEMNMISTANLPKEKLMVVYCDGIGCNASTKGSAKLISLGFRAKEMMGGIDWWKRDGYPVETGETNHNGISCGCE